MNAPLAGLALAFTIGVPPDDSARAPAIPPAAAFNAPGDDGGQDLILLADARPYRVRLRVLVGDRPLRAAWRDGVAATHARLDRNHDGKLVVAEADATGLALIAKPGGGPLTGADADRDKDGTITVIELAEALGGPGAAVQVQADAAPDRAADALFDVLDRDKDGQIARAELATAAGTLRGLDRDDDERIAAAEVPAGRSGAPRFAAGAAMGRPAREVGVPPLAILAKDESPLRLTRLLMKAYDVRSARGGNKPDSRLTPDEFAIPPAAFAALDANRDQLLSAEELRKYVTAGPPDAALDVAFPGDGDGPARVVVRAAAGDLPPGFAIRQVGEALVEVEAGLYRLEIQVDAGQGRVEAIRGLMQALCRAADTTEDGYLDAAELAPADGQPATSPLAALLGPLDADGDGKLFPADLDEYVTRSAAEARGRLSLAAVDEGRALFGLLDRDGDRQLGAREVHQCAARVLACDRDGDGRVAPAEVPHHVQITLTRGDITGILAPPVAAPPGAAVVVPNAVGTTTAVTRSAPILGPEWFRRMDRNRDGDVSRREFLGPIAQFDRLDRDGDGLLGPAEADAVTPAPAATSTANEVKGPGG